MASESQNANFCDQSHKKVLAYQDEPQTNLHRTGENGIKEMRYHAPEFEGDRHFLDIYYDNGTSRRKFQLNQIIFAAANSQGYTAKKGESL